MTAKSVTEISYLFWRLLYSKIQLDSDIPQEKVSNVKYAHNDNNMSQVQSQFLIKCKQYV